jgi:GNAT superfamily N-acetyltransferase
VSAAETLLIHTSRTADLDQSSRRAVIQLCLDAHQEPDFENLFTYLPPDGLHVMGFVDGRLVSHAVYTTRWMRQEDHPLLKTAWIDAVSTAPDVQRRGYGSAIMRHLAQVITPDYAIAGLQTDDKLHFYAQVGWELWRGALAGRHENGDLVPTPEQTGVMILRLPGTPPLKLDGSLTMRIDGRIW